MQLPSLDFEVLNFIKDLEFDALFIFYELNLQKSRGEEFFNAECPVILILSPMENSQKGAKMRLSFALHLQYIYIRNLESG